MHSTVPFETALSLTGFGLYQGSLLAICSLIYLSCGFQNGLNAYVMLAAQCDLKMSSTEKGLLNVVFLLGGISCAFIWGFLADHIGRKKVLVVSLLLDSILTFSSSFSQNFFEFAIFRFFSGFLIGCPASLVCTYLGEFLSDRYRSVCLCITGIFWTVSWLLLPLTAMAILSLPWEFRIDGFVYNSWRLYVAIFSAPTALGSLLLGLYFPESPKYLYSIGDEMGAISVMSKMFSINYRNAWTTYPVRSITLTNEKQATIRKPKFQFQDVFIQASQILKPPILGATLLASALQFTNMFGYYGLGLWLPELFDRFEDYYATSNTSVTVCELPTFSTNNGTTNFVCEVSNMQPNSFYNTFVIGVTCLAGNIICSLLVKPIGLKMLTIVTMAVSGACTVVIYFLSSSTQNLIISCIFMTFISVGNTVITSVIYDLFPTKVRGLASCTALFIGRLGSMGSNLVLGFLLDISCETPLFLIGAILFAGSLLGLLLPGKTTKL